MTDQADSHIRVDMRNTGSPGNEYVLALCETMIPMTMNTDIRFHCICGLQLKYLLCRNSWECSVSYAILGQHYHASQELQQTF